MVPRNVDGTAVLIRSCRQDVDVLARLEMLQAWWLPVFLGGAKSEGLARSPIGRGSVILLVVLSYPASRAMWLLVLGRTRAYCGVFGCVATLGHLFCCSPSAQR